MCDCTTLILHKKEPTCTHFGQLNCIISGWFENGKITPKVTVSSTVSIRWGAIGKSFCLAVDLHIESSPLNKKGKPIILGHKLPCPNLIHKILFTFPVNIIFRSNVLLNALITIFSTLYYSLHNKWTLKVVLNGKRNVWFSWKSKVNSMFVRCACGAIFFVHLHNTQREHFRKEVNVKYL